MLRSLGKENAKTLEADRHTTVQMQLQPQSLCRNYPGCVSSSSRVKLSFIAKMNLALWQRFVGR